MFCKLVSSARLFMKKASFGYCVSMFDSSFKPTCLTRIGDSCVPGGSGTEFELQRITSCEEGADAKMNAPMDHESRMGHFCFRVRRDLSRFTSLLYFRSN